MQFIVTISFPKYHYCANFSQVADLVRFYLFFEIFLIKLQFRSLQISLLFSFGRLWSGSMKRSTIPTTMLPRFLLFVAERYKSCCVYVMLAVELNQDVTDTL